MVALGDELDTIVAHLFDESPLQNHFKSLIPPDKRLVMLPLSSAVAFLCTCKHLYHAASPWRALAERFLLAVHPGLPMPGWHRHYPRCNTQLQRVAQGVCRLLITEYREFTMCKPPAALYRTQYKKYSAWHQRVHGARAQHYPFKILPHTYFPYLTRSLFEEYISFLRTRHGNSAQVMATSMLCHNHVMP